MCFGGGGGSDPNYKPAGYTAEQSHTQVAFETTDPTKKSRKPAPTTPTPMRLITGATPGLNTEGM